MSEKCYLCGQEFDPLELYYLTDYCDCIVLKDCMDRKHGMCRMCNSDYSETTAPGLNPRANQ